jgi:hypothetical protein
MPEPREVHVGEGVSYALTGDETDAERVRLHEQATREMVRLRDRRAVDIEQEALRERERPLRALERLAVAAERIAAALEARGPV